jgi:UDP-2-acetamido-3-amino-2,3-dideoxy-glucuronate N-acetyltransferase
MKRKNSFVGLVGSGYWGKNILRNLHELGVLRTLCDANKTFLNKYRQKYHGITVTTSFDEMLADQGIKAVAIATPASTHYDLAKTALEADKDVFVEKPLALTGREGEELVELAQKKDRILMVGHILHYHPEVMKLKAMIKEGKLGKIHFMWPRYRELCYDWSRGSGHQKYA